MSVALTTYLTNTGRPDGFIVNQDKANILDHGLGLDLDLDHGIHVSVVFGLDINSHSLKLKRAASPF